MTTHEHDHDHSHHLEPESPTSIRVRALESLLIEKGLMTSEWSITASSRCTRTTLDRTMAHA